MNSTKEIPKNNGGRRFSISEVTEPIGERVISFVDNYCKPSNVTDENAKKRLYRMVGLAAVGIFGNLLRFSTHVVFSQRYPWSILMFCLLWVYMVHHNRYQTGSNTSFYWAMLGTIPTLILLPIVLISANREYGFSYLEGYVLMTDLMNIPLICVVVCTGWAVVYFNLLGCLGIIITFAIGSMDTKEVEIFAMAINSWIVQSFLCFVLMATEERSEQQYKSMLSALSQTLALKTKFVSWVSHDLRTPLVGFSAFIDMLMNETNPTPVQKQFLDNCVSCTNSMSSLINNLLDFSQMESNQFKLQPKLCNIARSMEAMSRTLQLVKTTKTQMSLNVKIDESLSQDFFAENPIWCDFPRLEQVISNLVINSIKYSPSDSKHFVNLIIEVNNQSAVPTSPSATIPKTPSATTSPNDSTTTNTSSMMESNEDKYLELTIHVEDNGMGMKEEQVKNIFQPFFQVNSNSKSGEGTGLGLFIVSEIVKSMGAKIDCKSIEGKGTTMKISDLRFRYATPVEILSQERRLSPIRRTLSKHSQEKQASSIVHLLVAEDNRINQTVFRRLADKCGVQCTFVNNGQEAVDEWRLHGIEKHYDLIVMDLQMPIKDGFQAAAEIRKIEKQRETKNRVNIVALTASPVEMNSAIEAGMNDCLLKPLSKQMLLDIVSKCQHKC